jgi:hypothetical protein
MIADRHRGGEAGQEPVEPLTGLPRSLLDLRERLRIVGYPLGRLGGGLGEVRPEGEPIAGRGGRGHLADEVAVVERRTDINDTRGGRYWPTRGVPSRQWLYVADLGPSGARRRLRAGFNRRITGRTRAAAHG